jgi:hypothetical protein
MSDPHPVAGPRPLLVNPRQPDPLIVVEVDEAAQPVSEAQVDAGMVQLLLELAGDAGPTPAAKADAATPKLKREG